MPQISLRLMGICIKVWQLNNFKIRPLAELNFSSPLVPTLSTSSRITHFLTVNFIESPDT